MLVKTTLSIGFDVGNTGLKMVCLKNMGNGYRLMAHAELDTTNISHMAKLIKKKPLKGAILRANIEDPSIKIRKVTIPKVPPEEKNEVVKWAAKDFLGGPVDEFVIKSLPFLDTGVGDEDHIVYAALKSAVAKQTERLKEMGFYPLSVIEPTTVALAHAAQFVRGKQWEERTALIALGKLDCFFLILDEKGLLFSRPLGGGSGDALTKQIARNLGISENEAEILKKDSSTWSGEVEKKIQNTFQHFFTRLEMEIERSMEIYFNLYAGLPVQSLLMTGGASKMDGLIDYLKENIKMSVNLFDPFKLLDLGIFSKDPTFEEKRYSLATALGLALD